LGTFQRDFAQVENRTYAYFPSIDLSLKDQAIEVDD